MRAVIGHAPAFGDAILAIEALNVLIISFARIGKVAALRDRRASSSWLTPVAARAGERQPAERQADEPHAHGDVRTAHAVAGADTTTASGDDEPTDRQAGRPE